MKVDKKIIDQETNKLPKQGQTCLEQNIGRLNKNNIDS